MYVRESIVGYVGEYSGVCSGVVVPGEVGIL